MIIDNEKKIHFKNILQANVHEFFLRSLSLSMIYYSLLELLFAMLS